MYSRPKVVSFTVSQEPPEVLSHAAIDVLLQLSNMIHLLADAQYLKP